MPPIANDRVAWSVCHIGSPAKKAAITTEAIEIPFALRTRVGPGRHLLHTADLAHVRIGVKLPELNVNLKLHFYYYPLHSYFCILIFIFNFITVFIRVLSFIVV